MSLCDCGSPYCQGCPATASLKEENAKLRAELASALEMAIAFEKERDEWSKKTQQANLQAKKLSADRDAMVERLKRHSEERDHYRAECHLLRAALDKAEAAEDLRSLCSDLDAKLRAANLQNDGLKKVLQWGLDHVGGWREVIAEWDDFGKSEALGKAMSASLDQIDVWRGDVREVLGTPLKPSQEPLKCEVCYGPGRPMCAGVHGCYCRCHGGTVIEKRLCEVELHDGSKCQNKIPCDRHRREVPQQEVAKSFECPDCKGGDVNCPTCVGF